MSVERRISDARIADLVGLIRSTSGETRPLRAPFTNEEIAQIPVSSLDDVDAAFVAAREAQLAWAATPLATRKRVLRKFQQLLTQHQDEILDLIQLEGGKVRRDAWVEVMHTSLNARYYRRTLGKHLKPERRNPGMPILMGMRVHHTPKGVVGVISPWNYPLTMAIPDALAAIAAGNAVVQKPDSQSPLTMIAALALLREAGLPQDVWQVVSGSGSVVGAAIIEQADYICFTGSTATGIGIAKKLADRLVGASLELGGKNPMIVLPGADVERTAAGAIHACFHGAGQTCVSIERLYVHDSLYDDFKNAFSRRVDALEIGPGDSWETEIGSLVSADQVEGVIKHVQDAIANGASVVAGGNARPDLGPFFHEPTVLEGVTKAAACYGEETFGPLVSLYRYFDVEDAVRLANEGEYGLNASVWGPERDAKRIAPRIKAGTINVNEGFMANFASIDTPMGGMRMSGTGRRHGREGILRYTEPQTVAVQRFVPTLLPDGIGFHTRSRIWSIIVNKLGWMVKP
jgi:succinate-semialdehyde dehydrogenase/glutarate-semialdehyde dehydrogenase